MPSAPIHADLHRIYDATKQKTLLYITNKCKKPQDISDIFQETDGNSLAY